MFISTLSGTLSLGAVVHSSNPAILPVSRRDFPLLADFDVDSIAVAGHSMEPVVVVVGNSVESDTDNDTVVATVVVAGSDSKSNRELRVILPFFTPLSSGPS